MITGFNTNVRHGGRVFHVQTEDSGRAHPHLITHVYFGGTILATEKTSYADRLAEPELIRVVRGLMETQHKRMLAKLERGDFDAVIAERLDGASGARIQTRHEVPVPVPRPETPRVEAPRAESSRNASTEPRIVSGAQRARAPVAEPPPARSSFGERSVSEKSLDALIFDYLVDKARASRRNG
jgi:hypothetical protein